MKRVIIICLFLFNSVIAFSQATTRVVVSADVPGRKALYLEEPKEYTEVGQLVFNVRVSKLGKVTSVLVDKENSTVKDTWQVNAAIDAAWKSLFDYRYEAADTLVNGVIKYDYIQYTSIQMDSVNTERIDEVARYMSSKQTGQYKLYPTENLWIFLELDTVTGRIWLVQYTVKGPGYRYKTVLNSEDLRHADIYRIGRFELYKTQNMYNFILLDTTNGNTWQVQWAIEDSKRGILPIEEIQ